MKSDFIYAFKHDVIWPGVKKLLIPEHVIAHFMLHRQIKLQDKEAGGQLFGRFENDRIICEAATGPHENDIRARYSYRPAKYLEQNEIHRRFEAGLHYLGDWHTHPESNPIPSKLDIDNFNFIFNSSSKQINGFIMIIIGKDCLHKMFIGVCNGTGVKLLKRSIK